MELNALLEVPLFVIVSFVVGVDVVVFNAAVVVLSEGGVVKRRRKLEAVFPILFLAVIFFKILIVEGFKSFNISRFVVVVVIGVVVVVVIVEDFKDVGNEFL